MKTTTNKVLFMGILAFCLFSTELINSQESDGTNQNFFTINKNDTGISSAFKLRTGGTYKDWDLKASSGNFFINSDTQPRLNINGTNGNVGIGITNPLQKLHVDGFIQTKGIRFDGSRAFLTARIGRDGYNHFSYENRSGHNLGNIYFFEDTWRDRTLKTSSGAINLYSRKGTTIGRWSDPILTVDTATNTMYGTKLLLGSNTPTDMVNNTKLTVDGRVYISEAGGTETGFTDTTHDNYLDFLLWVEEGIVTTDIAIADVTDWPDYVFNKDYKLPSLESVEKNIKEKGHLHTMLSAKTIEENGFTVADITNRIIKTIEELTLHTINQEKLIKIQKNELEYQNKMIKNLCKRLETLEEKL